LIEGVLAAGEATGVTAGTSVSGVLRLLLPDNLGAFARACERGLPALDFDEAAVPAAVSP
jgi:hypothetical protein